MLKNNRSSARPPSRAQARRSIEGQTLPVHAQNSGRPAAAVGLTTAPAGECQRAQVRNPEIEETVAKIVGTTAAPRLTSAPVAFDSTTGGLPEWGRWRDVQRLFGIKRGTLYNLKAERKIISARVRGCRVFDLASVRAHVLAQIQ